MPRAEGKRFEYKFFLVLLHHHHHLYRRSGNNNNRFSEFIESGSAAMGIQSNLAPLSFSIRATMSDQLFADANEPRMDFVWEFVGQKCSQAAHQVLEGNL